ncbi:hypothetical protein [Mycobacterium sp. SMC-4]|uniref:hypothetical protein n=1 Tax=Mycobacterium sp. SMC-4 TaxID=2857059 RepID=UPI003D02822C
MSFTRPWPWPRHRPTGTQASSFNAVSAFVAGIHAGNGLAHGVLPPDQSRTRY